MSEDFGLVRRDPPSEPGTSLMTEADFTRLRTIAAERSGAAGDDGYRIGPDDLLEIRIPDLTDVAVPLRTTPTIVAAAVPTPVGQAPAFQDGVRVGSDGEVPIPQIGRVRAVGLTPNQLASEIAGQLKAKGILRHPEVNVLVAEYRSRVVGVVGSVERPGLYPLTRPGATISDMILAAGGPSPDAGRVVNFIPASPSTGNVPNVEQQLARGNPVRIDLETLMRASTEQARVMNLPARPGDVLSVAPAGTVLVDGWVGKPGSYPITRNLTLSGAIAAAGGATFPADRAHAEVKRVMPSGESRVFTIDLDSVSRGATLDLPMADGDVVHLRAAFHRLVPYGGWILLTTMFRIGGSLVVF